MTAQNLAQKMRKTTPFLEKLPPFAPSLCATAVPWWKMIADLSHLEHQNLAPLPRLKLMHLANIIVA